MRDAKVEEIEHLSDSDSEEQDTEQPRFTVGIFPTGQAPTYLHFTGKQVFAFAILYFLNTKMILIKLNKKKLNDYLFILLCL